MKTLTPWYSYVEKFAGISGNRDGLPQLPDGEFLPAMEMNCVEKHVAARIKERFKERAMIIGRTANHTAKVGDRGPCQYRNKLPRGLSVWRLFQQQLGYVAGSKKTGNLTLRPYSIVLEVIYDKDKERATGVRIMDAETMKTEEYYAKIVFLNASTLGTTLVLVTLRFGCLPEWSW